MKIYLDNCCFNRPFDDQSSLIVYLETEAKLYIQELIRQEKLQLCWSFVLDYENSMHPFEEVRNRIVAWKTLSCADCSLTDEIANKATTLMMLGLCQMDASHIACAIHLNADYFLTTDKKILNKRITETSVMNPIGIPHPHLISGHIFFSPLHPYSINLLMYMDINIKVNRGELAF